MNWPGPGEEPEVRTTILHDTAAVKSAAQHWASEKHAKIRAGVWMWWTDGLSSDNGQVGAAVVCNHRNECRSCHSFVNARCMEVFDAELWGIGLAVGVAIEKGETLQIPGVKTVAVFGDAQAPMQ